MCINVCVGACVSVSMCVRLRVWIYVVRYVCICTFELIHFVAYTELLISFFVWLYACISIIGFVCVCVCVSLWVCVCLRVYMCVLQYVCMSLYELVQFGTNTELFVSFLLLHVCFSIMASTCVCVCVCLWNDKWSISTEKMNISDSKVWKRFHIIRTSWLQANSQNKFPKHDCCPTSIWNTSWHKGLLALSVGIRICYCLQKSNIYQKRLALGKKHNFIRWWGYYARDRRSVDYNLMAISPRIKLIRSSSSSII